MDDKNKNLSFHEAYEKMKEGKKIARPSFKGYWFIDQETGSFFIHLPDGRNIKYGKLELTVINTAANDWFVVE